MLNVNYKQNNKLQTKLRQKKRIKIYIKEDKYYVDHVAYALNLLSIEEFYNAETNFYYIDKTMLDKLEDNYDIEFFSLKHKNAVSNKIF